MNESLTEKVIAKVPREKRGTLMSPSLRSPQPTNCVPEYPRQSPARTSEALHISMQNVQTPRRGTPTSNMQSSLPQTLLSTATPQTYHQYLPSNNNCHHCDVKQYRHVSVNDMQQHSIGRHQVAAPQHTCQCQLHGCASHSQRPPPSSRVSTNPFNVITENVQKLLSPSQRHRPPAEPTRFDQVSFPHMHCYLLLVFNLFQLLFRIFRT